MYRLKKVQNIQISVHIYVHTVHMYVQVHTVIR